MLITQLVFVWINALSINQHSQIILQKDVFLLALYQILLTPIMKLEDAKENAPIMEVTFLMQITRH